MAEVNLLDRYPRSKRPIAERGLRKLSRAGQIYLKTENRANQDIYVEHLLLNAARQFGKEYFDGDRLYGYGGYYYDPRFWTETVKRFQEYYQLQEDASILDVGCAKGFMLYDFKRVMPNATLAGLDISAYAYDQAPPEIKPYITIGNGKTLPYPDRSFDLVVSINTVDHLPLAECKQAIREIQRVARKDAFLTVNAWRNEIEKVNLLKWNITALTYMHVDDWKKLFKEIGYQGDYYWFIAD
jgi:SAM-dependent methyltransferase